MSENDSFQDFIHRIRSGDQQAAAELVKRYEPVIRCQARLRMTDPRLGRLFDSMDICQSVMASFFVRAAVGQYDLNQPEDLLKLLGRMARNKVISQARRQRARAADRERAEIDNLEEISGGARTPASVVAGRDLLAQVQERLDDEERLVAILRSEGRSWPEIAAELGGTPEARRKQLTRALDRVAQELGLEEQEV